MHGVRAWEVLGLGVEGCLSVVDFLPRLFSLSPGSGVLLMLVCLFACSCRFPYQNLLLTITLVSSYTELTFSLFLSLFWCVSRHVFYTVARHGRLYMFMFYVF